MGFDFKRSAKYEKNIGDKDQKIRYIGGAAALAIAIFTANIILLLMGIYLVGTAYMTWCPILSGLAKNSLGDTINDTGQGESS